MKDTRKIATQIVTWSISTQHPTIAHHRLHWCLAEKLRRRFLRSESDESQRSTGKITCNFFLHKIPHKCSRLWPGPGCLLNGRWWIVSEALDKSVPKSMLHSLVSLTGILVVGHHCEIRGFVFHDVAPLPMAQVCKQRYTQEQATSISRLQSPNPGLLS
mmetsp:Transcript_19561/g.45545  ORF Transcript_19561/g.45545 Transcript_19561/m.45545 type:complete len:159 (+) Transcript_19561:56-532(+)